MTFAANHGFTPVVKQAIWIPTALIVGACVAGICASAAIAVGQQPESPRQQAQATLKRVTAAPLPKGSLEGLLAEPVQQAQAALKRADGQHGGKQDTAALHEAAALEWALVAEDLLQAAKDEAEASQVELQLKEARAKVARARALLEETQARKGRLGAQVKQALGPDQAAPAPSTAPANTAAPVAPANGGSQ